MSEIKAICPKCRDDTNVKRYHTYLKVHHYEQWFCSFKLYAELYIVHGDVGGCYGEFDNIQCRNYRIKTTVRGLQEKQGHFLFYGSRTNE
jgi:hypothetical protein